MSFLPVTCDAARGLHGPKETSKRCTENGCTSFKPTWTNVDRKWSIFRTFCCGKQYHIAGNTVVNSCHKIRNIDDRDFSPKMTFSRTLKIFRKFEMCRKSLRTNWTPRQRRVQLLLERLGGWTIFECMILFLRSSLTHEKRSGKYKGGNRLFSYRVGR